jgi:hypothetical protein
MFISPVSGESSFALVSFTYGKVSYELDHDRELIIRLPVPATQDTRVRGVGVPLQTYYRLDAVWSRGQQELHVPLADVLARERLEPDDVGVFAFRDLSGAVRGYLPVYATAPNPTGDRELLVVV